MATLVSQKEHMAPFDLQNSTITQEVRFFICSSSAVQRALGARAHDDNSSKENPYCEKEELSQLL